MSGLNTFWFFKNASTQKFAYHKVVCVEYFYKPLNNMRTSRD